jgi:ADP-heptose:LPS heptosyltransferase
MIGIYDFSYGPYALGDALTWTMNLNVGAAAEGCDAIDQYLVIDPLRPGSRYQPFVNQHNYVSIIDSLFPAFLCSPMLRSLKLIRDHPTFNLFLLREVVRRRPMWPPFYSHLNKRLDFVSHRRINAFYRKHGDLPWLTAPRGYEAWADAFYQAHCGGRFVVAVNIRQGALSLTPANLFRDSPLPEWHAFIRRVAARHPDVLFLILGGYTEWDRGVYRLPNVLIPRAMGYGLGHELALLHRADLFMGSSSGFAAMATFCNKPYLITNIQNLFSQYIDVPVGGRRYPFGNENQILHWGKETQDVLLGFFEELRARVREKPAS